MKKFTNLLFLILVILFIGLNSCYKTTFYNGDTVNLRFSVDTMVFDTVFTTIGSATRILKVYNDYDQAIKISSIELEEGENSKFRLNIDGLSTSFAESIEIAAYDSIYIFGEVTIDPDQDLSLSPFVLQDHLIFQTNGNSQKLLLEAWGQNANYIGGKNAKGKAYITTCDMGTISWNDPKPYVIYGTLLVDSCTVHIPEGTQVYVHGGYALSQSGYEYNDGQIYFLEHGKLNVEGSLENPVVFQTDRLEHKYDDISGLWSGLYFLEGSNGNSIKYATLKNANIGLYLDSAAQMEISHTQILHNISAGVFARHADFHAVNSLIADSGAYGLMFRYGGNYSLDNCTVANYDNQEEALYMGNYHCRDFFCDEIDLFPLIAHFRNCIFYGNGDDELFFEDALPEEDAYFQYTMENCLIAVEELTDTEDFADLFDHCPSCINGAGEEQLFIDIDTYNYRPDTNSIVIDKGIFIPGISDDLQGLSRDDLPDIGCYEFN